jgi:hypothetical protein
MAASENLTLIRMLVVLALFVPVMLFGLYHTDVKKHGIFSESARDNEIGKGGKMHIASADELKSEFDPTDAHDAIREIPEVRAAWACVFSLHDRFSLWAMAACKRPLHSFTNFRLASPQLSPNDRSTRWEPRVRARCIPRDGSG